MARYLGSGSVCLVNGRAADAYRCSFRMPYRDGGLWIRVDAPAAVFEELQDNHILWTAGGSSFMNVFNAWYYSFSPYVTNYERPQP